MIDTDEVLLSKATIRKEELAVCAVYEPIVEDSEETQELIRHERMFDKLSFA